MKRLLIMAFALCLGTMAITSCQKDEKDNGNDNGNATTGVEAVDLGLSVKWASCNLGATKPEAFGDYYAWGEIETKNNYAWSNYKWCNGSSATLTKYCTNASYGTVDNKSILDSEDDVAHVKWGGSWHIPTFDEMNELFHNCQWEWTKQNNTNGFKVTGPNGNWIFLPAAGFNTDRPDLVGQGGFYWSSSLDLNTLPYEVYHIAFDSDEHHLYSKDGKRFQGLSVRPVCSK